MKKLDSVQNSGFTIVELLVAIVIIGILAALSVVSYVGINQKAIAASLQSDLNGAATQLKLYQVEYGAYPTSMDETSQGSGTYCPALSDTRYCVKTSLGNTFSYTPAGGPSPQTFTLDAANGAAKYRITNNTPPVLVELTPITAIGSITGTPQVGSILTAGALSPGSATATYQWQSSTTSNGVYSNISGATSITYTPVSGDATKFLKVKATAMGDYSGSQTSSATTVITIVVSVKPLTVGANHTCALNSIDQVYCWGEDVSGQVGYSSDYYDGFSNPIRVFNSGVLSGKTIKAITGGQYRTCAIASDNNAYCWGAGLLGDGSSYTVTVPIAVDTTGVLSGKTIKSITASGADSACVIASDDLAYCWGTNSNGQLGDNSYTDRPVPVAVYNTGVLSGKTIKQISTGLWNSCAIASDNNAYCWGSSTLGNNSVAASTVPVAVSTAGVLSGKTVKSISTFLGHKCVIASDNLAYCWGPNSNGMVGDNSTTQRLVPVAVNTAVALNGKTIKSIYVGSYHTCVIASDNLAYCWGLNSDGQLGNNSTTRSLVPVAVNTTGVLSGKTIVSISAGGAHTCVVTSDANNYCWGRNVAGQLGNGTLSGSLIPVAVNSLP